MRRHGHLTIRSYRRTEIEPYRKAAKKWLRQNSQISRVLNTISRLNWIIDQSGRPTNAASVSGHSPVEKARIALARLRVAGKNGKDLLLIALTVMAAQTALGPSGKEYRHVQIAKMTHRLASGAGEVKPEGYVWRLPPKWPRAEGIMMRLLGGLIEERSELVVTEEVVEEVIRLARGGSTA